MSENDTILTREAKQELETALTSSRIVELQENPVKGSFDAAHLKEIHRRIFQDLPALGIDGISPGEFRSSTDSGHVHKKTRNLCELSAQSYVCYSWMDKSVRANLDKVLEAAKPTQLSKLKKEDFAKSIGDLYAQLDYIHPFKEGNSRTLREFTRQLAKDSGYEIDWQRHNKNGKSRDDLYLARDRAVGNIALQHLPYCNISVRIEESIARFKERSDLQDLMKESVRPNRAAAFEKLPKKDALREHPELGAAYDLLRLAEKYYAEKSPDKRDAGIQNVKQHIQNRLNEGETQNFRLEKQGAEKMPAPTPAKTSEPSKSTPTPTIGAKPKEAPEPDIER